MARLKVEQPDWETLVVRHATPDFIPSDPISFPHRYVKSADWRDVECTAFLSALFSYGNRTCILKTLESLFLPLGEDPVETLMTVSPKQLKRWYAGFYYRFNTEADLLFCMRRLAEIYHHEGSLKALWQTVEIPGENIGKTISRFRESFLLGGNPTPPDTYGMRFLFANPAQNSAAKRFNLFLRWMVRSDKIDFGLWQDITSPAQLKIPLDTHVASVSRRYGILTRKTNSWQAVEEITTFFQSRCLEDPVKYDFALFGLGLEKESGR